MEMEDRPEQLSQGGQILMARSLVWEQFYDTAWSSEIGMTRKDVYVVWFCKTLQNWKALVSTNAKDDMYYEVTYNGDKGEAYIDAYKKTRNVVVSD